RAAGAKDERRLAILERQRRDEGVKRPLAGGKDVRMLGVEAERGAAVLQHDPGSLRDDPAAKGVEQALDQRDDVALAIRRAEVDGVAVGLGAAGLDPR